MRRRSALRRTRSHYMKAHSSCGRIGLGFSLRVVKGCPDPRQPFRCQRVDPQDIVAAGRTALRQDEPYVSARAQGQEVEAVSFSREEAAQAHIEALLIALDGP